MAAITCDDIDLLAWKSIKMLSGSYSGLFYNGYDLGELSRWFLWSKVGRALRAVSDSESFAFEETLISHKERYKGDKPFVVASRINEQPQDLYKKLKRILYKKLLVHSIGKYNRRKQGPMVYIPYPSKRLEKMVSILNTIGIHTMINTPVNWPGYSKAEVIAPPSANTRRDSDTAEQIHAVISKGLERQDIQMLNYDSSLLLDELRQQISLLHVAEREIEIYSPDAVIVHGDNHSPYQEYVAAARKIGIPSITFQHGLDCERYYLDDAFASAIAVWSELRSSQYQQNSQRQPELIKVTGNPGFDHITSLPTRMQTAGKYWLWATRPHASFLCYSPSRKPKEGIDILNALMNSLENNPKARLVIKPHPNDYTSLYRDKIMLSSISDRIIVSDEDLDSLIRDAQVVISEDSTAGLEAMLAGKILIHSHFSKFPPVLPWVNFGAALPGFTAIDLDESLSRFQYLSTLELETMLEGQKLFISRYAGPLDGKGTKRLTSFYETVFKTF